MLTGAHRGALARATAARLAAAPAWLLVSPPLLASHVCLCMPRHSPPQPYLHPPPRYKTPWDKIDVDFLVEETKKLGKEVKGLNKAVST